MITVTSNITIPIMKDMIPINPTPTPVQNPEKKLSGTKMTPTIMKIVEGRYLTNFRSGKVMFSKKTNTIEPTAKHPPIKIIISIKSLQPLH